MNEVQEDRETGLCDVCRREGKLYTDFEGKKLCNDCVNILYEGEEWVE